MPGSHKTNTLRERFQREERWDEMKSLREQLKSEGWTPREAYEHLGRMFPPGQDLWQDGDGPEKWPPKKIMLDIAPFVNHDDVDWDAKGVVATRVAVDWVFEALGRKNIMPRDAPSAGAWSLYEAADRDRPWFYQTYHAKTLPSKAQVEAESAFKDDGRELIGIIEKLEERNDGG